MNNWVIILSIIGSLNAIMHLYDKEMLIKKIADEKKQITSLQMDRDEIKVHTNIMAAIIKTQQYQIDVLTQKEIQ